MKKLFQKKKKNFEKKLKNISLKKKILKNHKKRVWKKPLLIPFFVYKFIQLHDHIMKNQDIENPENSKPNKI